MSIFLLILKIIGIVLLSVIGLILFLVMLVLFVPLRYSVKADYDNKLTAKVTVSYLLHILSIVCEYDGEKLSKAIKIFGISLKKREKKESRKKPEKPKKKKEKTEPVPEYTLEGFDDEDEYKIEDPQTEYYSSEDIEELKIEEKGFWSKLKEYITYIYNLITGFTDKIRNLYKKLTDIKDNLTYYLDLITDEKVKETLTYALGIVFKILKAVGPKKIEGKARFGFDDPATTGKVLSFLAIVYPMIGGSIIIIPEFDEEIIEGNLFLRGRIFIITLLIQGWKLYFNRDIRKVIKDFKREK